MIAKFNHNLERIHLEGIRVMSTFRNYTYVYVLQINVTVGAPISQTSHMRFSIDGVFSIDFESCAYF